MVSIQCTARATVTLMRYGELLRRARESAGRGLRETARAIDVSPSYLSKVESGKADPMTTQRTIDVAKFVGTDPLPLVMALQSERGEVRLDINGDTRERRRMVALLELRWTQREVGSREVGAMLDVLEKRKR